MTTKQIKDDLENIKYYYYRQKLFDEKEKGLTCDVIFGIVEKYNKIMSNAPAKLYDVYYSLYVKNHTQESFSDEVGFTQQYIAILNRKLITYLKDRLSEQEVV